MDNDFRKYNNIILWLTKYKKQEIKSKTLDRTQFIEEMQKKSYVAILADVKVILVLSVSGIEADVAAFRKIYNSESHPHMIFVTKRVFTSSIGKAKLEMKSHIENLRHMDFACEKPNGPLCPTHIVMSEAEVKDFCDFHHTKPSDYPPISIYDPQCMWANVKTGDLVKIIRIENNSAGETCTYRFVTRRTFNMTGKKEKLINVNDDDPDS
jgi:DNA-directed RNA polymerase subunit H (RpoH/RPB5)